MLRLCAAARMVGMSDEQPQTPAPEWIPVPPPHPFAGGAAGTAAAPGRGIGIAAMALGLAALLTAVMAAISLPLVMILAVVLGLAAVALGIVALVKRQRPRATGLTGLVAGGLALLVSLALAAFGLGSLAVAAIGASTQAGEEWAPESVDPQPVLIEWPANMRTGGIIFAEGLAPRASEPLTAGEAPAASEVNRDSGVLDIRLYVDYRCPYCSIFEQENGDALAQLVDDGAATLELVPLTFLDRVSEGSAYSSRAAAAVACVVDAQPEAAWAAHAALLAPEVQPAEGGPGHTNDELIALLDARTGGLSDAVADCVSGERFVPFAQALNSWVFSTPVPNAVDPALAISGTPFAVVNGIPYEGDPADSEAFRTFLAQIAGY